MTTNSREGTRVQSWELGHRHTHTHTHTLQALGGRAQRLLLWRSSGARGALAGRPGCVARWSNVVSLVAAVLRPAVPLRLPGLMWRLLLWRLLLWRLLLWRLLLRHGGGLAGALEAHGGAGDSGRRRLLAPAAPAVSERHGATGVFSCGVFSCGGFSCGVGYGSAIVYGKIEQRLCHCPLRPLEPRIRGVGGGWAVRQA